MLRALKITLPSVGNPISRRRQHQFAPSIAGSAANLEDRALLSAAGGAAHAAVAHHAAAARDLAETPVGRHVIAMYESILHTAPTTQQVNHWVHRVRGGGSLEALRRQFVADARAQAITQAAIANDPTVSISPTGVVTVSGTGTTRGAEVLGNLTTLGADRRVALANASTAALDRLSALGSNARIATFGSSNPLGISSGSFITTNGTVVTRIPINTISTAANSITTAANSITAPLSTPVATVAGTGVPTTTSPLGFLDTMGAVPTPGLTSPTTSLSTIGTQGSLTFGRLPVGPVTFSTLAFPVGPANASPMPNTGTLPFTGTPANPSPMPNSGTLPFTGTPANPSPIPVNGTLPFTGTPANPSPVPATGTLF